MEVVNGKHHAFEPFARRPPRLQLNSRSQQFDYSFFSMLELDLQKNDFFCFTSKGLVEKRSNNNLHRSVSTPCLSPLQKFDEASFERSSQKVEIIGGNGSSQARGLVAEVANSMTSGLSLEPVSSGLGGTYFLESRSGDKIAVVKPMDEEPMALNNPKGFAGGMLGQPGVKSSIRVGDTCHRELAAYLLDHDGFSGVAPTALVRIAHPGFHVNDDRREITTRPPFKIASLQRFQDNYCDSGELGSSKFSISSVHRIGILDVRTLNLDRHAGNILVKRGEKDRTSTASGAELIPIDHGLCLPNSLDDPYFEWMHWPQASLPFSDAEIEYISKLDPFKDAKILKRELPCISESSIRVLVVCTKFLKQAVISEMCLADIGEMMTRHFKEGKEECSELEYICMKAKATLANRLVDDNVSTKTYGETTRVSSNNQQCDFSQALQNSPTIGKPTKIPRFSSMDSFHGLDIQTCINIYESNSTLKDQVEIDKAEMDRFVRNDGSEDVTFGQMSDSEWKLFLKIFDEMLVEVLEDRKCMCLSKLRSYEFQKKE